MNRLLAITLALALAGFGVACGGNEDSDDNSGNDTPANTPAQTTTPGVAAAQPATAGGPTPATIGGPAATLNVPPPPHITFTVTEPGEYQIDAMAAGADAQAALYSGTRSIASDSDSGDGTNARIVEFLAPGSYQVYVTEYRHRQMSAQARVQKLAPLTPVGALTAGTPMTIAIPAVNPRPRHPRFVAREATFTVAAAGNYQCDATSVGRDAQMAIIQNGAVIAQNSDGGEGNNARITRNFTPGEYRIRVWDWMRRDISVQLNCTAQQ